MRANAIRRHVFVVGVAAGGVVASVVGTAGSPAAAATSGTIPGTLTAIAVSGGIQVNQLFAGADGQMWFVTPESQLGEISTTGQATLTGVTLPHGEFPASIAAAGPEGIWTYSMTNDYPPTGNGCFIGLVTSDGVLHDMQLPSGPVRNQMVCASAAADGAGNLWISLASRSCSCRVAIVAEMTPSGSVTTFAPTRAGARPHEMALGSDGAMWILEGFRDQNIVRYTSAGASTSVPIYARPGASGCIGLPDGMFWVQVKSGFMLFNSHTATFSGWTVFPVRPSTFNATVDLQTGVDAIGSLWKAGQMGEFGPVNRLFRLDTSSTIGRTRSFPLAADGSQLLANGTAAVSTTGAIWAAATSGTGATYLIRFQPLP